MSPVGPYLALSVPGLAEGRPSLLIGDRVILSASHDAGLEYEGYVHEVCDMIFSTSVLLGFSK